MLRRLARGGALRHAAPRLARSLAIPRLGGAPLSMDHVRAASKDELEGALCTPGRPLVP
jgi:hypothetical protein